MWRLFWKCRWKCTLLVIGNVRLMVISQSFRLHCRYTLQLHSLHINTRSWTVLLMCLPVRRSQGPLSLPRVVEAGSVCGWAYGWQGQSLSGSMDRRWQEIWKRVAGSGILACLHCSAAWLSCWLCISLHLCEWRCASPQQFAPRCQQGLMPNALMDVFRVSLKGVFGLHGSTLLAAVLAVI